VNTDENATLRGIAFEVCTALFRAGTTAVLSGGGAAALYAPDAIQSYDLDFIITLSGEGMAPGEALGALGYRLAGQHYENPASKFLVEFPPGPLAIGDDLVSAWETLGEGEGVLHVISPTDSCRDRLAAFYHFQDRSALGQALAVFREQAGRIHLDRIRLWSEREGQARAFDEFRRSAEG